MSFYKALNLPVKNNDFLVAFFFHIAIRKSTKQHGQGNNLENSKKILQFEEITKLLRFEKLGQMYSFLHLKLPCL